MKPVDRSEILDHVTYSERRDALRAPALAAKAARRVVLADGTITFLFENRDDPRLLGLDPDDTSRVTIVGGAGVDPTLLHPAPLVPQPPLKVAIVARMLNNLRAGFDQRGDRVRLALVTRMRMAMPELDSAGADAVRALAVLN